MRKIFPLLLLCLFLISEVKSQTDNYVVQVAAFDRSVPLNYFKGLSDVYHLVDVNNIHKYYIGGFDSESTASATASKAKKLGYNARVIDVELARNSCSTSCSSGQARVKSIFFDYDKYFLKGESKVRLDQLFEVMIAYPDYKVELSAHTDSKGSTAYNEDLAMKRAQAAKDYLLKKGLSSTRIEISTFGEYLPIAKNDKNGTDLPSGRKLNRRVELVIYDTKKGSVESMVDAIYVPEPLRL